MASIKRTAPKPLPASTRRPASSCSSPAPAKPESSCGGWVSKGSRATVEKKASQTPSWSSPRKPSASVSSCGGWGPGGKLPSGC